MEIWGCFIGAAGLDSGAHGKLRLGRGCCRGGGRLGWADKGGLRGLKVTRRSACPCPAVSSVDTNGLISRLISASKQQRLLTGGQTGQWLIKGG